MLSKVREIIMNLDLKYIQNSLNHIFSSKKHLAVAVTSSVFMAILTIYAPVLLTPGNTVSYQLSLMQWYNFVLIGTFSILFGLSFAVYYYAAQISGGVISLFKGGSGSGLAGFTGALFSSPVCISCLSTILAAVGIGGSAAITLFQHQTKVQALSVAMLGTSFYFASIKLELNCEECDN